MEMNTEYLKLVEKRKAIRDEMRYAVNNVSVFPVMEELLNVMEA